MNRWEALIVYLADLGAAGAHQVAVSGPLDLGPGGPVPPTCIVDLLPGVAGSPTSPGRTVEYRLRFYGPDDLAALDAYEALRAAARGRHWERVRGGPTLKSLTLTDPAGPLPEPDTGRPVFLSTATARWAD